MHGQLVDFWVFYISIDKCRKFSFKNRYLLTEICIWNIGVIPLNMGTNRKGCMGK